MQAYIQLSTSPEEPLVLVGTIVSLIFLETVINKEQKSNDEKQRGKNASLKGDGVEVNHHEDPYLKYTPGKKRGEPLFRNTWPELPHE